MVEQSSYTRPVLGSNPSGRTYIFNKTERRTDIVDIHDRFLVRIQADRHDE